MLPQAGDIKEVANYTAQLRRIGNDDGHGVWDFDKHLHHKATDKLKCLGVSESFITTQRL